MDRLSNRGNREIVKVRVDRGAARGIGLGHLPEQDGAANNDWGEEHRVGRFVFQRTSDAPG